MTAKKSKRTRPPSKAVRNQTDRIFEHIVGAEVLAGNLIRRFARRIEDQSARGKLFLDFRVIARALAAGDPETKSSGDDPPQRGVWERYAYHFQNQNKRRKFFAEIDLIAKRYLADVVFRQARAAVRKSKLVPPAELFWNETLLPRSTAPHLLRQWISDSAATRRFLTALFQHFADIHRKGSLTRRTIIAANVADYFGWKPQKITKRLCETEDVKLGQHEYKSGKKEAVDREASTVGRSVRRMRKADEERRAKLNAEKGDQKAADHAAVKQARLLKVARAGLITCLARRIGWTDSAFSKPSNSSKRVIIGIRRFGDRGAVLTFKEFFPEASLAPNRR